MTQAGTASAQSASKQLCLDAYESAQVLTRDGDLVAAREKLVYCSSAECPQVMHRDCQRWLLEVEDSTPTVVFRIDTKAGPAAVRSSVSIDGSDPVLLDGRAISVNPGRHEVTFSAEGLKPATRTLVFSEGEKLRQEVVVLDVDRPPRHGGATEEHKATEEPGTETAAAAPPTSGSALTLPVVLASSAVVVGGAGFAYFGLTARAEERDLDECSPNCTQQRVDAAKQDYLLANVSLGLGVAGLLTAGILVLLDYPQDTAPATSSVWIEPLPTARGLSLSGRF